VKSTFSFVRERVPSLFQFLSCHCGQIKMFCSFVYCHTIIGKGQLPATARNMISKVIAISIRKLTLGLDEELLRNLFDIVTEPGTLTESSDLTFCEIIVEYLKWV
jgi:hypothetical protein